MPVEADLLTFSPASTAPMPVPRLVPTADYVALREDGQFACLVCGAPAAFGSGVSLRKGVIGAWLCLKHWREGVG